MNLIYLLVWVQYCLGSYHKGNYLFTETVKGTCDFSRKSQYIYDYKDLGGNKLDDALSIGFGFWFYFDTSRQELLYNVSNLFFLSDNDNTYNFRIISFGLKKYGINSTLELLQQDQILKQGPSININTQDLMDDKWLFVYVSYDFLFLKYQLGVFQADQTVMLNSTFSCPNQLKYCTNETLPQPFLKREKLKLYIAQNGPYRNDSLKGRSWCGSVSGFQYYLDVQMVSDYNLDSIMYGFDKQGIYLNYLLTQMSGNQLYDYSGAEFDVQHDIAVDWTDQAFTIKQPLSINIPLKRFLYDRFFLSFWLKADAGINFAILQRMVDSLIMFELDLTYYAIGNYYFFTVIRENLKSQINVQFNVLFTQQTILQIHQLLFQYNFIHIQNQSIYQLFRLSREQNYKSINQWNFFVLIFNYDKITYEEGTLTKLTVYKNNENPQIFDLNVPVYYPVQDSDILTFGKRDTIPAGKSLQMVNFQLHQGARVFSHKSKEAGDITCLLSAPKLFKYNCLLCADGYFLLDNKCVTSSDCTNSNGVSDAVKKICLPQCDIKCKTCNNLTPTVCTLCINNLQLNAGVCSCPNNGYIGTGKQLKCKEYDEVKFTEIGTYNAILNYVKSGSNYRKDELQISFKQSFSSIPSVIVAFKEIKITKGNSFKIMATQVTQETFVLQVEAWDQTTIENIVINYFATLQSDLFVLMQEGYDTSSSFAIGTGSREYQAQILLNEWNMKLHYPKVIPFFNGMQFIQGTNNISITLNSTIDNVNKYLQIVFKIKGDIQISKIYYSFILISEEFEALTQQFNSQTGVLWIAQTGAQKQNSTLYSFKNQQTNHFYGISVLGYSNSEIKNIAVSSELNTQINKYNLQVITDDYTIIELIQIQIIGIGINCQTYGCSQCDSSPVDCLTCKDNLLDSAQQCLNCASNQYLDSKYQCQNCKWNCLTCSDADQCITCPTNVNRYDDPANKCPCQNGYYDNGVTLCVSCDWRCETCEKSATTCLQCKGANRNFVKSCLCNDQFYEVGTDLICKNCQEPCDQCNVLGCLTCLGNRIVDGNKQCICPAESVPIPKSQYCETCDTVEVSVTLNETTESLSIFFVKANTSYVTQDYKLYNSQDLCIKIIESSQLPRFGTNPKCSYNGTNIDVEFGNDSLINLMEEVQLIEKIFIKDGCKIPIKKYVLNILQFPTVEIYSPQFTIEGPLFPVYICKAVTLNVNNIKFAGKRQLSKLEWKLIESDANQTVIDNINAVLKDINQNNQNTITFNSKQFQNFTNYTFQVTGLSFATKVNSQTFKLQTLGLVQPVIQADITHFNHYFKQSLIIPVTVYYQICQSTKIVEQSSNLTLYWVQIESNPTDNKPLIEESITESIQNKQHYLKMQPKEGYPDTTYIIQAQLMYQDTIEIFEEQTPDEQVDEETTDTESNTDTNTNTDPNTNTNTDEGTQGEEGEEEEEEEVIHIYKQVNIFTFLNFTIEIDYVGVSVIILGGDRFITEGQSLTLEAQFWDGLDEGSSYNSDSNIGLQWKCIQIATNRSCELNDGTSAIFEENVTSITLEGEIFRIGQQYQVQVTAYKDLVKRYSTYVSNIICSFKSVDELIPEFPIVAQTRNIDLQQPITFTFLPNQNLISYYNFTLIVLYDNQEISKQLLNYPQKTLKLNEYLPSALPVQTCTIQIIQQSLSFYQMAILPIMFNTPPQNAQITISSYSGVAIETVYNILIEGAEDEDLPLQYRLSMYTSQSNFQQDLMQSNNLNQIILSDYQFSNSFSCRLPSGFDSNLITTSYIVLMAQIKDSRGAVSNVTIVIGNSPQFKLWKAYLISVNDFKSSVTLQSEKLDVIASSLELLSFYFDFYRNEFNYTDLAPTMKVLYAKLKSQVINDIDAIYSRNKILNLYDRTMFQMYLLNETEKQNLIQTKLQSILDISFQFKTKLLASLALSQQREIYGDLTSVIDIDYFQFTLIEQLKQFSSILSFKLNVTKINETYILLQNTTLQKWRLNHTQEALEMDAKEEEEKANGITIEQQLIKYNTVVKFIQPFTVEEIFIFSNLTISDIMTQFRNQFNFTQTQLTAITDGLQKLCKINEAPLEFSTTFVSIKLQLLTYDYFKQQYNYNDNYRLLTQLNSTYRYLIVVHKYNVNPYMIDDKFFNFTGTYAFDQTFPLYVPLIYEVSNNTILNALEDIENNQFSVDFLVPNSSLSILNQYQCAQKKTNWRSDDSNCTRKVEYLTKTFQFKIWCVCPYFSETTLIRPFYVEEIALLKPKLFGYENFMEFYIGQYIIGITGALLCLSLLGVILDKSNADKIKQEEEEMEKERIQIIFSYRVKKRRAQQEEEASKTFLSESKAFSNSSTQTESQPIHSNKDIGIQELSVKLVLIGIFKLQELISVFLYYDNYVLRPIRFLAIYLKLVVMLSVSGVLVSEVNIIQQYGIIILVSEISALVVKIVKAIFSGKLIQIMTGTIVSICILAFSFYSIIDRASGQEQEYLDNWMKFYGICIGIYFIVLDPIQSILKMCLYPWCRKQIESQQETPVLHLIYFLITQNDLRTYYKITSEKKENEEQDHMDEEKDHFQDKQKKDEQLQEI